MSFRQRITSLMTRLWAFFKRRSWPVRLLMVAVLVVAVFTVLDGVRTWYAFRDDDPGRGATTVKTDPMGDTFSAVRYVNQGWTADESLWFYNTTQGSNLIPYDFFLALEKAGTTELLRSHDNMNRYRYLTRKATLHNPDSLAIGFVKDVYLGKKYLGLTCAACHTAQLIYNDTAIRVDGGPAGADMDLFVYDLEKALYASDTVPAARQRFIRRVLDDGNYDTEFDVLADLRKYQRRITTYRWVNHPQYPYGYARLDAFGRIYNRVIEHVASRGSLRQAGSELVLDGKMTQAQFDAVFSDSLPGEVITVQERDRFYERLQRHVPEPKTILYLWQKMYNKPSAPVSYPFLWDIPQHDFVQWNGLASNAGLGPVGRNTGEVIGVFATLDWSAKPGLSPSAIINGDWDPPSLRQLLRGDLNKPTHISYKSSVDVVNLRQIEDQLTRLHSPRWKDTGLPRIDTALAAKGEHLFDRFCASCHSEIDRANPYRRVVAHISSVKEVGTDSMMAVNSVRHQGRSGILQNQYVGTAVGALLIESKAPVAELLTKATIGVVATPDPDHWWPRRFFDWARELVYAFLGNEIKPSIRRGNYTPDNTVDPFASLVSYKARSLNGIWATAPYLHNGSVPTLYDLLLRAKEPGDPPGEYRPDTFLVGSRVFDPRYVGFKREGYPGFLFKTSLDGNRNTGHDYPPRCPSKPAADVRPSLSPLPAPDTKCRELTPEERWALVEYMKRL